MSRKIRELAIPKYKKDWPGKTLLMKEACPIRHRRWGKDEQPSLLREGDLVTIERFCQKTKPDTSAILRRASGLRRDRG